MAESPFIAMVAGEASGDILGAHLIDALRVRFPQARFAGIGGPKMQASGFESWFPMEKLAVRGYLEVLRHYLEITAIRRRLRRRLLRNRPSLFVGIDAPDFNLALERGLKLRGVSVVHYVSPSVWAWRGGRIRKIGRSVNELLVLFPFEVPIYAAAGIASTFVGHPAADAIPLDHQASTAAARTQLRLAGQGRILALLPGSRESELHYMAATFIQAAKIMHAQRENLRFLVPLVSRETRAIFESALYRENAQHLPITILFGHARDAIAASDAVLVASGTATLETALHGKPMVIAYKMAETTWNMMSRMRYQPYVGLPNIIAGEFIVPELLQDDATPENLAQALLNVLDDPAIRVRLPERFAAIHRQLGQDSGRKVAEALLKWLPA